MFWFYLSHSRTDAEGGYIRRFFSDLAHEVRTRLGLAEPPNSIGFLDVAGIDIGKDWAKTLQDALTSARTFVPLYSPSYFQSEYCGKEFQLFKFRVERYAANLPAGQQQPRLILPVLWQPLHSDTLPPAISQIPYNSDEFGDVYAKEGLLFTLKLQKHADDYQQFLMTFANALVGEASEHIMPRLDALPLALIQSVFHQPEKGAALDLATSYKGPTPASTSSPRVSQEVEPDSAFAESTIPRSAGVFISYRRQESALGARLLFQELSHRFGPQQVFIDVDSIVPGADFAEAIVEALSVCKVLLALIGPQWATVADAEGRRRLDDPDDTVRLEIRTALDRHIAVIPVLLDGAPMPGRQQLPKIIAALARHNALELSSGSRFSYDIDRLFNAVERIPNL